jgi:hypothetical protein
MWKICEVTKGWTNFIMRSFTICKGEKKCIENFSREILKRKYHLGDTGVEERMILKWFLKK